MEIELRALERFGGIKGLGIIPLFGGRNGLVVWLRVLRWVIRFGFDNWGLISCYGWRW